MQRARFYIVLFCWLAGIFVLANFVIWQVWVADLRSSTGGDLARMGYLDRVAVPKNYDNNLALRHLELHEYPGGKVDVLTLGDSFSNHPTYYQDHLAAAQNLSVLNIEALCEGGVSNK